MKTMHKLIIAFLLLLFVCLLAAIGYYNYVIWQVKSDDPKVWQRDIEALVQQDRNAKAVDVLFIGSSTIRFWRSLASDMAPYSVVNRGFGGAKTADINYYFAQLVPVHQPKIIVYYAGDNDMSMGELKSAEQVQHNFAEFVTLARAATPNAHIVFVSIKPSADRIAYWPQMQAANRLIKAYCQTQANLSYVDISQALLNADATPNDALYIFDGVHLNKAGYARFTAIIKPKIIQLLQSIDG